MGVSRQVMGRRTGIVLPVVLGTLIVVVMLVGAIAHLARASYEDGLVGAERMRTDWVLQAGLNRAVRALVTPGDVLREDLFGRHLASWAFDGEPLSLRMDVESEKVDANRGDSLLLARRLDRLKTLLPSGVVDHLRSRLDASRARGIPIPSTEIMLPLDDRSGPRRDILNRAITVFSGQTTPSAPAVPEKRDAIDRVMGAAEDGEDAGGPAPGLSRPLYRLTAILERGRPEGHGFGGSAPPERSASPSWSVRAGGEPGPGRARGSPDRPSSREDGPAFEDPFAAGAQSAAGGALAASAGPRPFRSVVVLLSVNDRTAFRLVEGHL